MRQLPLFYPETRRRGQLRSSDGEGELRINSLDTPNFRKRRLLQILFNWQIARPHRLHEYHALLLRLLRQS